jgi:hypothetical protein
MALRQIIQHPTGTYSEYWKVRSITINHTEKTGTIIVDGYVSQQARNDNKVPLDERTIPISEYDTRFSPSVIDSLNMNEVKASYLFLKDTNSEFLNAEDT